MNKSKETEYITKCSNKALNPATNDVGSTYLNVPIAQQGSVIITVARKLLGL